MLNATAAITANIAQSSTLWNGWAVEFNANAGAITLTPNGADTIFANGLSQGVGNSFVIAQGCNGSITTDAAGNILVFVNTGRIRLSGNSTIYVSTTGSDSANTGLTSGSPFATLHFAYNYVQNNYDLNGHVITFQLADGTYTAGITAYGPIVGITGWGSVVFNGNATTPTNVVISTTSADCFDAYLGAAFTVQNLEMKTTTGGFCMNADYGGLLQVGPGCVFGACATAHIAAQNNSLVGCAGNYKIVGGAPYHWLANNCGQLFISGFTITITGTPAFSTAFAFASVVGAMSVQGNTFSGSATGVRYSAASNGVINTNGGGSTYLPGGTAGTTATGGEYI